MWRKDVQADWRRSFCTYGRAKNGSKIWLRNGTKYNNTSFHMLLDHCYAFCCRCSLPVWRSSLKKGTPVTYFSSALGGSIRKTKTLIRDHEYFITIKNLTGSKISKPSSKFVFFGPIGKTRWPPRPLIGWDIFDFSVETAELNSTNLDRKQDLNALYQVCVFRADRKNKMAAWPLIGWDIFDFSPRKPLNRIRWNLIGSKISTPSTKFFLGGGGRSEKQNGRPGLGLAETFSAFTN